MNGKADVRRFLLALIFCLPGCGGTAARGPLPFAAPHGVTPGARIASIQIRIATPVLPLGQISAFSIVARDGHGATITGAYDPPIVLRAKLLALSSYRIANSTAAGTLTAAWASGASGGDGSIVAQADGHSAKVTVHASSGFTYYDAGSDPATDVTGFQIAASRRGTLFFGTLGPQTCSGNVCSSAQGAIGELDPRTGRVRQIALPSEVLGLLFSSDGALWIAGGSGHLVYRMAPGPLSTPAAIVVPTPQPAASDWGPRLFAEDAHGNVWFGDAGGHRLLQIPLAGPYDEASIVPHALPDGPAGTPRAPAYANGLALARDGNLYLNDYANGVVDRLDPSTGRTTLQTLLPQQRALGAGASARPRFAGLGPSGVDVSLFGASTQAYGAGAIDEYRSNAHIVALRLPNVPAGSIPDSLSIAATHLYYADVFAHAVGYVDQTTGKTRLFPVQPFSSNERFSPNGIAAMTDGTAWFTCQDATVPLQPLCVGHTTYLTAWSLFPGPSFSIGAGAATSQVVGIVESPARDSGPFRARSDKPGICSVSSVADHDFVVTGKRGGRCTVSVTDAKGGRRTVEVVVVAP